MEWCQEITLICIVRRIEAPSGFGPGAPPIRYRHSSKDLLSFQRNTESSHDEPRVSEVKKFDEKDHAEQRWVEITWELHNY